MKPSRQSLLDFGVPPPAAALPPLLVEQAIASTGLLFYRAHGLAADSAISFRAISSTTLGAPASRLPSPLREGVTYFAQPVTPDAFGVSLTAGAARLASFGTSACGSIAYLIDPADALDAAIDEADVLVVAMLTGHHGDVDADIVTNCKRALAARLYVVKMAIGDPAKAESYAPLAAMWTETYQPMLDLYLAGTAVKGGVDATPTIAEGGARYRRLGTSAPFGAKGAPV